MHRSLLVLACCILAATNSAQALTVGKTTTDPNLSGVGAQFEMDKGFWTADKRLAQKVTLEARRKTVLAIFSEISNQTGVRINVGYNEKDWQVRDRKMVIFAKDMPLSELMQSIGRVMKFKWERTQKGSDYSYRIFMDRSAVMAAEAESARAEERYNREQCAKREKLADGLKSLGNLSQEEIDKLRKDNPAEYALAASGLAGSLDELFAAMPAARNAFVGGNELIISKEQNAAQVQSAMTGVAQAVLRMNPDTSGTQPTPEQLVSSPQRLREIRLYLRDPSDSDNLFSRCNLGQVAVRYTNSEEANASITELSFPIMDPDTSMGKGMGEMLAKVLDAGSMDALGSSMSFKIDAKEIQQVSFGEPIAVHKEELEVKDEIDFSKIKNSTGASEQHADRLAAFAEITKFNIVSDSFASATPFDITGKVPADSFLRMIETMREYNWWKHGSIIELRDRRWFRKRSLQVPEAWLEKWRAECESTETLDIATLADMAVYVGEADSYEANIVEDPILNNNSTKSILHYESQSLLRFYATLTPTQRKALYTQNGLNLATLTSDQKNAAIKSFTWWNGKRDAVITGTRTPSGKRLNYKFVTDGMNIGWVTTPIYEPRKPAK